MIKTTIVKQLLVGYSMQVVPSHKKHVHQLLSLFEVQLSVLSHNMLHLSYNDTAYMRLENLLNKNKIDADRSVERRVFMFTGIRSSCR